MKNERQYEVSLQWHSERSGTLATPEASTNIEVDVPWNSSTSDRRSWTPEHLLVAAVNACLLSTFLAFARNMNVRFVSFECNSVATIAKINEKLIFTQITLKPTVVLFSSSDEERIRRILEISKKTSAISSLLKVKMNLEPCILIQELATHTYAE